MAKSTTVQLKDIAQEANVSVALVSYVLNGRHTNRIKKETAENIKAIAERLNYRPNHFAKGLKTQKSNTIGLILADLANPFSAQIARIIEDEATASGYMVLMGSTDENEKKLKQLVDTFLKRQVDGLIILPTEDSEQTIEKLHESDTPYVLIDRYFPSPSLNFVVNDNQLATYMATQKLIKNGRKKIGFITIKTKLLHFQDRKNGFMEACTESGIPTEKMIKEVLLSNLKKNVNDAIKELLNDCPDLDALLFSTAVLTMYGLRYSIKHQLEVPKNIEIMGFDEAEFYTIFPVPITFYKQPLETIGQMAVSYLVAKIKDTNVKGIKAIVKGELFIAD